MASLAESLNHPEKRPRVVRACVELVEAEVAGKRGLSGAAVRAGYKVVRAVKPTFAGEVVDRLLPEFATALEELYREAVVRAEADGRPVPESFRLHLEANAPRAAEALLVVTDRRAEKVSGPVKKAYQRLRGVAGGHVEAAVPGLARTLAPFL